jgi:diguanylate cyclase (GGDEF)-like protein
VDRLSALLLGAERDRSRIAEIHDAMNRARTVSGLVVIAAVPLFVTGNGWWPLAVCVFWVAWSVFANARSERSDAPDLWILTITIVTQAVFGICGWIDGGPTSPAMMWLVFPLVTAPARYSARGVKVSVIVTALFWAVASFGRGWDAFVAAPQIPAVTLSAGISVLVYARAMRSAEDLQRRAAVLDPLTGLGNRSALHADFADRQERCAAHQQSIGLLVCDLDFFKAVNDDHGHHVGDAVLVQIAAILRAELPKDGAAYRLGGEEFLLLLPGAGLLEVRALAMAICTRVETSGETDVAVTVSIGGTSVAGQAADEAAMFRVADAALYEAKRAGRNRVVLHAPLRSKPRLAA